MDIDWERVMRSPLAAGAIGSLVAVARATPGTRLGEKLFNWAVGCVIAGWGAPALCEWLNVRSENYLSVSALILGLVGMSLCDQVLKAVKETPLAQIWSDWLSRFSPKKGG